MAVLCAAAGTGGIGKIDDFLARHGQYFPENPQNLDELISAYGIELGQQEIVDALDRPLRACGNRAPSDKVSAPPPCGAEAGKRMGGTCGASSGARKVISGQDPVTASRS